MNFYIWAGIVTIVGLASLYFWVGHWRLKEIRHPYLYILLCLPLSALVNLFIKRPIGLALLSLFNLKKEPKFWPLWFLFIANFIAPLTEEAIKILPVILREVRHSLKNGKKALTFGLLFGFGFGIGEAWYLAAKLTYKMPEFASRSFWHLIGFFGERTLCVLGHGLLTAIVCFGFYKNFIKYYLTAVTFHYLLNAGAALYQKGLISMEIAYIPIIIMFFVLSNYVFRIEEQLRKAYPLPTKEKILYKRED